MAFWLSFSNLLSMTCVFSPLVTPGKDLRRRELLSFDDLPSFEVYTARIGLFS